MINICSPFGILGYFHIKVNAWAAYTVAHISKIIFMHYFKYLFEFLQF